MNFNKSKILEIIMSITMCFSGSTLGYIAMRNLLYRGDIIRGETTELFNSADFVDVGMLVFCIALPIYCSDDEHNHRVDFVTSIVTGIVATGIRYIVFN